MNYGQRTRIERRFAARIGPAIAVPRDEHPLAAGRDRRSIRPQRRVAEPLVNRRVQESNHLAAPRPHIVLHQRRSVAMAAAVAPATKYR